ncbi:MAG TPA: GNVR domain-containing protein, partial [Sphingomicrobium sp.]
MNTLDPILRRGAAAGALPLEAEQTPFLRYMTRIVFRWKKVIAAIVGGCLLIGLIITLLMTPEYTAVTTIEVSRESDRITPVQGVRPDGGAADQEFYQTQYGLLKSRGLGERIATDLKLVDDPVFFTTYDIKQEGPVFAKDRNGRFTAAGRPKRLQIAAGTLLSNIVIAPVRNSRLIDIEVTSPDPGLSQRLANAWSENFIEATLQRRYEANSYARKFLEGRLIQLRARLEQSERELVGYASNQRLINLANAGGGERSIVSDDLTALNNDRAVAVIERVKAEARLQQSGSRADETSEALGNTAINSLRGRRAELAAEYQKLMVKFEPDYPDAKAIQSQISQIDRSLDRERQRIAGSLQQTYKEASAREQALDSRVSQLKDSLIDTRRRSIQYQIFQRDVDTNRQLYDGLLQRYKEIGVAGGVGVNNVSVVDAADLPDRPSSPRLVLNMLLALIAGSALGALAAFLLEQGDEAIADPTEVERMIGLPLLGTVPR